MKERVDALWTTWSLAGLRGKDYQQSCGSGKAPKGHFFPRYLGMISIRSSYQLDVGGKEKGECDSEVSGMANCNGS